MNALALVKTLFPENVWPRIWIVGGTVRDRLMGKEGDDIDLDAILTPQELTTCGFRSVDPVTSAPIWFRHIPGIGKIEVTLLGDAGQLTGDIFRRDFTVNTLAMPLDGELVDLTGGVRDLEKKELRACFRESFVDDPIRIFRAFRFQTQGWRLVPETESLITAMAEQARRAGIAQIIPLVVAGDKPDGGSMPRWEEAVRVAGMSTLQVGIERSRLEAMPVDKRADFVLQKRIEWFRREETTHLP
jgi:Poly A polymerase head domain